MLSAQVRRTENPRVGGSIPPLATTFTCVHTSYIRNVFIPEISVLVIAAHPNCEREYIANSGGVIAGSWVK